MLRTLKSINYNKKLIQMLLDYKSGAIAVNIIGPLFYFYIFNSTIPQVFLILFIIIQFSIFFFRLIYGEKIYKALHEKSHQKANKSLKKYLYFLYTSSFFWGLSTIFVVYYGDEQQMFIMIALIFIMLAGSLATLTPIFHAVFIFIINVITLFVLGLLIFGTNETYYLMSIFLIGFTIVTMPAAFKIHLSLRNNILKSEEIQALNNQLEIKVHKAILETARKEKLLQEQTRLAQMGEMISMIAHQWRQPLGAISSALMSINIKLESGKFDLTKDLEREEYFNFMKKKHTNIENYVEVLSNTIDDFRNFFKPDKSKEFVSLTTPITRALDIVQSSIQSKNIKLNIEFLNTDIVSIYQNEMMQVILNILKNSEDNFLEKKIQDPIINIITYKEDNSSLIAISDNGGGIPSHIVEKIFDPYFSTKDEKNGTGLGLYMSKIIVQEHNNGTLSVQNIKQGVRFLIELHNEK